MRLNSLYHPNLIKQFEFAFPRAYGPCRFWVAVMLVASVYCLPAQGQDSGNGELPRLEYVWAQNYLNGDLPQGRPFVLWGSIPPEVTGVTVAFQPGRPDTLTCEVATCRGWQRPESSEASETFEVTISRLIRGRQYAFQVERLRRLNAEETEALRTKVNAEVTGFVRQALVDSFLTDNELTTFLHTLSSRIEYGGPEGDQVTLEGKLVDVTGGYYETIQRLRNEKTQLSDLRKGGAPQRAIDRSQKMVDSLQSELKNVEEGLADSTTAAIVNTYRREARVAVGKSMLSFTNRLPFYVTLDVGLVWLPFVLDDTTPYAAINFYFSSVDKSVPLSEYAYGNNAWKRFWSTFPQRFSVSVGINLGKVQKENVTVEGLLGNKSIYLAAGLRLTDYLRASAGVLTYQLPDSNPLVERSELRASPLFALSIDVDILSTLRGMASSIRGTDNN